MEDDKDKLGKSMEEDGVEGPRVEGLGIKVVRDVRAETTVDDGVEETPNDEDVESCILILHMYLLCDREYSYSLESLALMVDKNRESIKVLSFNGR